MPTTAALTSGCSPRIFVVARGFAEFVQARLLLSLCLSFAHFTVPVVFAVGRLAVDEGFPQMMSPAVSVEPMSVPM